MLRRFIAIMLGAASVAAVPAAATAAGRCGEHPWCDTSLTPEVRAGMLLEALTRDERIGLLAGDELTGVAGREGTHTGLSAGVPRVDLPPIYFSDGPVGPRQGKATGMPSPMTVAASFDPGVAYRHAQVIGDEVRRKGNDVVFAPAVNMMRTPLNGRTFEYLGEDPYLAARIATGWTRGVQAEGVIANVKHYAFNSQEGIGGTAPGAPVGAAVIGSRLTVDARLGERALREIYLPQFEAAVKDGGAGSVMCSYPRVNGTYACENQHLLEDILKGDWGFKGFVLTDYGAAKNTVNSLNNGLDLDIWPALAYQPALVNAALASSQVSETAVDEHVRRILATLFRFGFFDRAAYVDDTSQIDREAHHVAAGEIEAEGIVLMRNEGPLLPLDAGSISKLAVIGPEADSLRDGGGSSAIDEFALTTPLAAFAARLGAGKIAYDDGADSARAAAVARASDAAVVIVGDRMSEGLDKPCLALSCGQTDGVDRDGLIAAVAAAQPRTVVVLQTGGPVLTPWREQVPALLEAWYPGQNGGTAMARVVFGDAEPKGRLPATFPVREDDEPTAGDPEKYPGTAERVHYKEGVLIGYRWFDEHKLDVAFPFGHGRSYTTFAFRRLRLEHAGAGEVRISADVRNTGTRAGTAVPQIYVGMPAPSGRVVQPPRQLKGFKRVTLRPGQRRRVTFRLDDRAFSYWSTAADDWRVAPGCYRIELGASSRDLPLSGTVGRGADCDGALVLQCSSRRVVTIRLPRAMRSARVTYLGRRARVFRRDGRLHARIDLRRLGRNTVTVSVTGRSARGGTVKQSRIFRTCGSGSR